MSPLDDFLKKLDALRYRDPSRPESIDTPAGWTDAEFAPMRDRYRANFSPGIRPESSGDSPLKFLLNRYGISSDTILYKAVVFAIEHCGGVYPCECDDMDCRLEMPMSVESYINRTVSSETFRVVHPDCPTKIKPQPNPYRDSLPSPSEQYLRKYEDWKKRYLGEVYKYQAPPK